MWDGNGENLGGGKYKEKRFNITDIKSLSFVFTFFIQS